MTKIKSGDRRLVKGRQEGIRGKSFLKSPVRIEAFYSRIDAIRTGKGYPKRTTPLQEIEPDYSEI